MSHNGYLYTTGMLMSCTRRQLGRISDRAALAIANPYTVYNGLDRAQTIATARQNHADALTILTRKSGGAR